MYFVTYAVVGWIDVFTREVYRNILLDSLRYCCANKGLEIYAWCLMTNHMHLIIGTNGDNMENILRDHKSHTAKTVVTAIIKNPEESRREWMLSYFRLSGVNNSRNVNYQFWQQHNKPVELYSKSVIMQKLDYIHNNPVMSGFVRKPEDWLYSSAIDYSGGKGLLECLTSIDIGMYGEGTSVLTHNG